MDVEHCVIAKLKMKLRSSTEPQIKRRYNVFLICPVVHPLPLRASECLTVQNYNFFPNQTKKTSSSRKDNYDNKDNCLSLLSLLFLQENPFEVLLFLILSYFLLSAINSAGVITYMPNLSKPRLSRVIITSGWLDNEE